MTTETPQQIANKKFLHDWIRDVERKRNNEPDKTDYRYRTPSYGSHDTGKYFNQPAPWMQCYRGRNMYCEL